ncbi:hypothetical protein BXZ70DRAFT_936220 [Cristinia sonorae]|uniref:Uncharacterized protein n=1 Tax=Cristinia sonorae TaxID=1940300 RepID=A0A8K0UP27_9AGAR|nr:hypothetical protein BXZ70DRAFT_936220 [Cristinia sonorae]
MSTSAVEDHRAREGLHWLQKYDESPKTYTRSFPDTESTSTSAISFPSPSASATSSTVPPPALSTPLKVCESTGSSTACTDRVPSKHHSHTAGEIVGGVFGSLIFLALVLTFGIWQRRRMRTPLAPSAMYKREKHWEEPKYGITWLSGLISKRPHSISGLRLLPPTQPDTEHTALESARSVVAPWPEKTAVSITPEKVPNVAGDLYHHDTFLKALEKKILRDYRKSAGGTLYPPSKPSTVFSVGSEDLPVYEPRHSSAAASTSATRGHRKSGVISQPPTAHLPIYESFRTCDLSSPLGDFSPQRDSETVYPPLPIYQAYHSVKSSTSMSRVPRYSA